MASFESVIAVWIDRKTIPRVQGSHPMYRVHKNFWGKDMGAEEATWRTENALMLNAHR
jgi:hypothetical protein